MHWDDWDVGEVDLAARNRVRSSEELSDIERRYWETRPKRFNVAGGRWGRIALALLNGRVDPLDPILRRYGVHFQVHAQFMRDTARLAGSMERARQRIREGKLPLPPPEAIARSEWPGILGPGRDPRQASGPAG
jgi:hypothetical protein